MLGGNVFGWTLNETDSFRILDAAFGAGLTFIDTADIYSTWVPGNQGGESETIIGKWFARSGKRNQVTIATKVGMQKGHGGKGLSAKYIAEEVEASLQRLQTDHIDLYQSHEDDPNTPLEETMGAFDKAGEAGEGADFPALRIIPARGFARRWRPANAEASRATKRCSRTTTLWSGFSMNRILRRWLQSMDWPWFRISHWLPDS